MDAKKPVVADLLRDAPKNWGKWGPDDEVGLLNYLTQAEVLRGVAAVLQYAGADGFVDRIPAATRWCTAAPL